MMKNIFVCLLLFCGAYSLLGNTPNSYMYRLHMKDKGNPPFSLDKPEEYLSAKSIERRSGQGLPIDSTDLPIDPAYLQQISTAGASIIAKSKWVNTVTVRLSDSSVIKKLGELPFTDTLYMVWKGDSTSYGLKNKNEPVSSLEKPSDNLNIYGQAYDQIKMLNTHKLHEAGFWGDGMSIAVLDGGFGNCDLIQAFDQSRIIEVKNFTHRQTDPFRDDQDHGTGVLSCMFARQPGTIMGTAPHARYYLFLTEVSGEEYPVEEDYWISGIEYADSIGVDIVNTSLGYTTFNSIEMDHVRSQLDGQAIPISRAANLAESKGMLLFNAAGNEGSKSWEKISFPADAENVITVGSIDKERKISSFSSIGPTADRRIKPDLVSMGSQVSIIGREGNISTSNGTSYASPLLAGSAACLWQALPGYTCKQIANLLKTSADRYVHPDTIYGYGVPDIYAAYQNTLTGINTTKPDHSVMVYADRNRLYFNLNYEEASNYKITIFNSLGRIFLYQRQLSESVDIGNLPAGVYITYIQYKEKPIVRKFIKY